MGVIEGPKTSALIERVRLILTQPATAWEVIDAETTTVRELYLGYACILAGIGPVAGLIGGIVFHFGGLQYGGFDLLRAIADAAVGYVLNLALIFVVATIADAIALNFGGEKSQIQAFKAVIYGCTTAWLGGALAIVPELAQLGGVIGVLYSLYLLWLGLPKLMKVPQDKALGFSLCVLLAYVLGRIVLGLAV